METLNQSGSPVRVLVVDDSLLVRTVMTRMISDLPEFELAGTACDGREAVERTARLRPDVVTLDIEMPVMDGLEALAEIMTSTPVPVVIMSSHSRPDAELTIRALELGAVDFITKPDSASPRGLQDLAGEIRLKLLTAARMRPQGLDAERMAWEFDPAAWPKKKARTGAPRMCRKAVTIGVSTGGPSALKTVVRALPPDLEAAVLVVQHMPAGFTRALAERLNELSPAVVKEAEDGETLCAGRVYLARGGFHLCVEPEGRHAVARLNRKARVSFFRPSIDVLMRSAAEVFGKRQVGVIMTGMSADGVEGIRAVKESGGVAIAQDEVTSAIFGMNRLAIETGLVDHVVPLDRIVPTILKVL